MKPNYADRARALVGIRFRPQGRDADGLDCVGVVLETFGLDAGEIRRNYSLRGNHREELQLGLRSRFRRVPTRLLQPGDVMLLQVADDQLHLTVRTSCGFVHAHAGLRMVVETPGIPEWPVLGVYRRRTRVCGS